MAKYVVMIEHGEDECLKALDEMEEKGNLDKFVFGCKSGEHVAFAYVDADTEDDALAIVPESLIEKAVAYEVEKLTKEELKDLHEEE